ncbi:MAG: hypothetical protein IR160_10905 [Salinibacterium sp.]|nr:hypothetical protein [Salinibacterium sp.]MBF0673079.1 hypothetical protein [Salinibacterium sp.]
MATKSKPPVGAIRVSKADGSSYEVDVQAPAAAVRFAVGTPSGHGFVWRLWSSMHTPDFYLAVRDGRKAIDSKYSFHASGDWRLQYEYSEAQALGVHRVLEKWQRPAPAVHGAIEIVRIMTPADDVVESDPPEPDASKIIWVEPGPKRTLNVFFLQLVPAEASFSPPSDADLVAALQLADESIVLLLHTIGPLTHVEEDMFRRIRQSTTENPPPGAPAKHVPRSDPTYRCLGFLRAAETHDIVLADLLM